MGRKKDRNFESLKPIPRPAKAAFLSKERVAITQLEAAIDLWFRDGELAPIMVLAFNGHDCLDALCQKKRGARSGYSEWLETMPNDFKNRARYVNNFCKHGGKDVDEMTPHDPEHAEILMYFAGRCFRILYGRPTPLLFAFDLRYALENPDITMPGFSAILAQLAKINITGEISRQKFLEQNLFLIEQLLHGCPP